MPTTYTDQFFVMDPGNPPSGGSSLSVQKFDYTDNNDNGFIGTGSGDTFNGGTITRVCVGDTITVNIPGTGNVTITGVTFYVTGQPAVFTPTDGTILQDATFVSSTFVNSSTQVAVNNLAPPCFTPGTMIETADGLRDVVELVSGDLVMTLDDGAQPLRWVGHTTVAAVGRCAPIRISAGALGNDRTLTVSPQHRILLTGWRPQLLYGEEEVLVAAKHLANNDTIVSVPGGLVTYIHLLFDTHQIVFAEGLPTESYYPGHAASNPDCATRTELVDLFPEIEEGDPKKYITARTVITGREARAMHRL